MALLIGDNFSYNGKKPNFERDSFETLAALKAFAEANIDNGHIAYCVETNKHYIFNNSNSDDTTTGKWRVLESEFSNKVDQSDLTTQLATKEDKFTVGTGLEMTPERVLNVTLDITVFKVVASLPEQPASGDEQKIHLVPAESTGTQNIYNEYIWVNNAWELLGEYQSEVDLTPYLTKTDAQATYQPIGNYATKEEVEEVSESIPSLNGYATETWVENKNYLTEVPIASANTLGGIKVGSGLSINPDTGVLSATGGGTADSVDWANVQSKPQINGHDLVGGNNTLDSLGIQPAGDYVLSSEIPTKTSELENDSGFLTSIPSEYITETELEAALEDVTFTLPVASSDTLGGIKVGAGLSISGDGILSATGGGVADSVAWENVVGRPTNVSQFTNDAGYITNESLPDLSDYATQAWVTNQGYLKSIPDTYALKSDIPTNVSELNNDSNFITISALTNYALKSEIPTKTSELENDSEFITNDTLSNYALKTDIKDNVYEITDLFGTLNPDHETVLAAIGSWDAFKQAILDGKIIVVTDSDGESSGIANATVVNSSQITLVTLSRSSHNSPYSCILSAVVSLSNETLSWKNDVSFAINNGLNSTNTQPVQGKVIYNALQQKQDTLISGTNIKTINGTSLLGEGNIIIEGSGGSSEITDVLDNKTYGRTQGSWVDLTDYLTWGEYE